MTWRTPIVALLFGACASTAAIAGSLDLNLNNDVVEASYLSDPTTFQYRFGALHDDRAKDWLGHAGFVALGEQENQAMRSTIGSGGRVEFEIIKPTTVIYLGYRKIEAKFKSLGTSTIEEGGHIGLRISF